MKHFGRGIATIAIWGSVATVACITGEAWVMWIAGLGSLVVWGSA